MDNLKRIQAAAASAGLDGILLMSEANRRYATGFAASDGAVVITPERAFFFTDARYIEAARAQAGPGFQVELCSRLRPAAECVRDAVSRCAISRLGAEEESLSYARYTRLSAQLGAELLPCQSLMTGLRASKSREELERLIAAQRVAEAALDQVLPLIRPGVRERDIAAELVCRMLKLGAERCSFDPIVVSGARTSMPHGAPGDQTVVPGCFVTMDFGCVLDGYCSDMTRTVAVGGATDEMKNVYSAVLAAQAAGIAAARPGVSGARVHAAAAAVIEDAGFGPYFTHGFGHGVGLDIHEAPVLSPSGEAPLPEGAVVSAEPGIYLEGRFGVRIEDLLYLTGDGCIDITAAPKELMIL